MKKINGLSTAMDQSWIVCIVLLLIIQSSCGNTKELNADSDVLLRSVQVKLPNQEQNAVKTSWPSIGCWFWTEEEFKPNGYKRFIDLHEKHSPFGLLTTSLRYPGELTDPAVHDQVKAAAVYAKGKGMGIVMDLDLRLARESFKEKYPDELQQIVLLREFSLKADGTGSITVKSPGFADHYTYGRNGYEPVACQLLRVYTYEKDGSIKAGSVKDLTPRSRSVGNKDSITVTVNGEAGDRGRTACALIAVTIYTPDVFAPHLLSYQRGILKQYADAALAGACKDEWGFPGRFKPVTTDLWYSPFMADEYKKQRPGQDLLRDMLLMSFGEQGQETKRTTAVNHYMELFWKRNAEIETDYYHAIKEILGNDAVSATHPTWYPFPDQNEIFKNGLSWWTSKRDLAQTDEGTPFCARTALAKKMNSPLWYNMYYEESLDAYYRAIWMAALGGGRLNYHPLWPHPMEKLTTSLLQDSLMKAESRVHLLNYISSAPVDCPVAVVFGHPAALNWTAEKSFADVGLKVTDALWQEGFYADLIPSSEISNGSLKISADGRVQYGPQQYEAVVFYHPEFDRKEVAGFFLAAAKNTSLYCVGDWTIDFEGNPFKGNAALPAAMKVYDAVACSQAIIAQLKAKGIQPYTQGEMISTAGFPASMVPKPVGQSRLLDGTVILVSGEKDKLGDLISKTITVDGKAVSFDAIGVAAVRLDKHGEAEAIAGGGLKSFHTGNLSIELPARINLALFKEDGRWRGIVHGFEGPLPAVLTSITKNWIRIKLPEPYQMK